MFTVFNPALHMHLKQTLMGVFNKNCFPHFFIHKPILQKVEENQKKFHGDWKKIKSLGTLYTPKRQ